MTLSQGKIGDTYRIKDIDLPENVKRRLEMLGMTHNSAVTLINSTRRGALIIKVRGTRFAIGRNFAMGITIGGVEGA